MRLAGIECTQVHHTARWGEGLAAPCVAPSTLPAAVSSEHASLHPRPRPSWVACVLGWVGTRTAWEPRRGSASPALHLGLSLCPVVRHPHPFTLNTLHPRLCPSSDGTEPKPRPASLWVPLDTDLSRLHARTAFSFSWLPNGDFSNSTIASTFAG